MMGMESSSKEEQDVNDIHTASRFLKGNVISSFVSILDSLNLMLIDSKSFTQTLHNFGINAWYLG